MNRHEILTDILTRRGVLTPAVVVDESRPEDAPLHGDFVWDNDEAGELYRQVQAAHIIRSVHVKIADEPGRPPQRVRAFLPVSPPDDKDDDEVLSSYLPIEEIAVDPRKRAIVDAQMEREWRQMRRRWAAHRAFWQMVQRDLPGEEAS